jgi:parvulin-like peptidyl-prolyl isomerase
MNLLLRPALALAAVLALACAGCGKAEPPKAPPAAAPTPAAQARMTVTHILVAFKNPNMKQVTRTREQAQAVAKSLLAEIVAGRSFDELVPKFTDDKDREGKPNTNNGRPGSYTFPPPQMMPAFDKASRETPVGKVAPEPVETPYGFHLIRRDA